MLPWAAYSLLLLAQISDNLTLGGALSESQMVECFSDFNGASGSCNRYLGRVPQDHCCLNSRYGFQDDDDRKCQSCRHALWSEWSEWSPCTVSCLEGVRQRRRVCYGLGECEDVEDLGTLQTQPCEEKSCCPNRGGWTEWGPWGACSVTCLRGRRVRERSCSKPRPTCGGSCGGADKETEDCDTQQRCPVNGAWAEWNAWTPCSRSCLEENKEPPVRHRTRTCTKPEPSTHPPGKACSGASREQQACSELLHCPVDGGWAPWNIFSECSVTCGVGERVKLRQCTSPTPKHGGQTCPGKSSETELCNTELHCPVDGLWSTWDPWGKCTRFQKEIKCRILAGTQTRARTCKFTAWGGRPCPGDIVESRVCYDINGCKMHGNWDEWSDWSLCKPSCGPGAQKTRIRTCQVDVSKYSMQVGQNKEKAHFSGKPLKLCSKLNETVQTRPCFNVPNCTEP